jgi:hypothetical protein
MMAKSARESFTFTSSLSSAQKRSIPNLSSKLHAPSSFGTFLIGISSSSLAHTERVSSRG